MQISKVSEMATCEGSAGRGGDAGGCRAASELFDLMAQNTHFTTTDEYSLSDQDVVLLYQNIDIGTRLMSDASKATIKKPNQYVETVVYNDEHESSSGCSESFNPSDIQDVYMINEERLNLLNDKSLENLLCPKFGGLDMNASNLSFDYDKSFLFQDPYIKNQLQSLNLMGGSSELDSYSLLSTSLIDYICCKRLEDNYNFYMDNIIRYVQNTIDQLKRISNGDYLTERTKEKWVEVNASPQKEDNTKVLATSTSIPLHVECRANRNATWDDLVRSEMDVRSLSKILEKKIVVEIPKLICGSYRVYSKRCADNLIISCQKEQQKTEEEGQESRVDVVLQLQRSQTGQVISKINSIMVLKTTPALPDIRVKEILSLPYEEATNKHPIQNLEEQEDSKEPALTVIQLIRDNESIITKHRAGRTNTIVEEILEVDNDDNQGSQNEDSVGGTNDYPLSDCHASYASIQYSSESSLAIKDTIDNTVFSLNKVEEKTYNLISPDELHMAMRKLNLQNSVLNESSEDAVSQCTSKRRSPVRIRIKSPYENKTFLLEEKKRKRLLEIRERREKKKIALSESCKISKHKYAKGSILPQASSSVTKLSITNKSFYNSIYGHSASTESKQRSRKPTKTTPEVSLTIDETQEDDIESPMLTPDKNSEKYINRSYYLDDAETEMMYLQTKKNKNEDSQNPCSASDSNVSNEFNESLEILRELIRPSEMILTNDPAYSTSIKSDGFRDTDICCSGGNTLLPISENVMPLNIAAKTQQTNKKSSSDECRKSIDQLYNLMSEFGKSNTHVDLEVNRSQLATNIDLNGTQIIEGSESGTSVKHTNATTSDTPRGSNMTNLKHKINKAQAARVPKVVISSKVQSPKIELDKMKRDRTRPAIVSPTLKGPLPDNPLKAISQLLHEFDNVQKNRQKGPTEAKPAKKVENLANDVKAYSRQGSYRRKSRIDHNLTSDQVQKKPQLTTSPKDKRARPMTPLELARTPNKQFPVEDRNLDRIPQKKIADIIDEAKEARGEAVRGPSKNNSRLISLAQPKKSYVQAHHEEYQNRYGRNVVAERLQKLATAPTPPAAIERNVTFSTNTNKNRWKKSGQEAAMASVKQRAISVQQIDQQKALTMTKKRRSSSSSPESITRLVPAGHKHTSPTEAADTTCKMVAVKYYVPPRGQELAAGLRCRVPLLPQDIDLVSMTSTQNAGDAMVSLAAGPPAPHFPTRQTTDQPRFHPHAYFNAMAEERSESDYCVDILEDCHVTTAMSALHAESFSSGGNQPNSTAEMEQLETALYNHISGNFQKRLRIKNLTLTPKSSMQQIFLLQSGDAGSVIVKSVSNHKLRKPSAESLHALKAMPVLSNSHVDWTFTQLPVQIATVGYAYPECRPQGTGSKAKLVDTACSATAENVVQRLCQASQCLRGLSLKPVKDSDAQVDVVTQYRAELATVTVESVHNHANSQVLAIEPIEYADEKHVSSVTANEVEHSNESDAIKAIDKTDSGPKEEIKMDNESDPFSKQEHSSPPSPTSETINYTTSLDMLVGLLTEIQKITCQNQMVASTSDIDISKDVTTVKKIRNASRDFVSLSSLENLRQLESNASTYSYYLSSYEGSATSIEPVLELKRNYWFTEDSVDIQPVIKGAIKEHMAVEASKPTAIDKEVSANLCERHADVCTSVSVCNVDRAPAVCDVNARVSVSPSSHSTFTIDYHTPHSSATRIPFNKNIIKSLCHPQIEKERRAPISRDKTDLNEKCYTLSIRNIEDVKKESLIVRRELYCVGNIDLDPMFKIKRDLLVSMYSILVLTVFAALSFPDLLIFQS